MGAARNPTAEPTPAFGGTITRATPDLLGDARRMQRRRAAERDQRVLADDLAALDRMHARRARHVLAHHLVHGISRGFRRQPQRIADAVATALRSTDPG